MAVSARQMAYLDAMDIQAWELRGGRTRSADRQQAATEQADGFAAVTVADRWQALETQVKNCTACDLSRTRTQTVFGVGNREASWLVIGEAPGADEDRRGEPFVGRAGQLLTAMLQAIGLQRNEVYIANILKCRPPNNRDPRPDEVAHCRGYLDAQIRLIEPEIILAVGRIAAQQLLATDRSLSALRGRVHHIGEPAIPVVVTYHPAYLLRTPADKRKAWQDLQLAKSIQAESANGPVDSAS